MRTTALVVVDENVLDRPFRSNVESQPPVDDAL